MNAHQWSSDNSVSHGKLTKPWTWSVAADCHAFVTVSSPPAKNISTLSYGPGVQGVTGRMILDVPLRLAAQRPLILWTENVSGLMLQDGGKVASWLASSMRAQGYFIVQSRFCSSIRLPLRKTRWLQCALTGDIANRLTAQQLKELFRISARQLTTLREWRVQGEPGEQTKCNFAWKDEHYAMMGIAYENLDGHPRILDKIMPTPTTMHGQPEALPKEYQEKKIQAFGFQEWYGEAPVIAYIRWCKPSEIASAHGHTHLRMSENCIGTDYQLTGNSVSLVHGTYAASILLSIYRYLRKESPLEPNKIFDQMMFSHKETAQKRHRARQPMSTGYATRQRIWPPKYPPRVPLTIRDNEQNQECREQHNNLEKRKRSGKPRTQPRNRSRFFSL